MKKYLMTLAAVLCCGMMATMFTACSSDDDEAVVYNYNIIVANQDYDAPLTFSRIHSVITSVQNAPAWLTVTPLSTLNSDGATEVTLKVKAAADGAERKCTIYLTTESNEKIVLTITQAEAGSDDDNSGNRFKIIV